MCGNCPEWECSICIEFINTITPCTAFHTALAFSIKIFILYPTLCAYLQLSNTVHAYKDIK